MQLNSGKVIAVGPGTRDKSGNTIPVGLKEGDTVLLPEYGGTEVKLGEKQYVFSIHFAVLPVTFVNINNGSGFLFAISYCNRIRL